MTDGVSHRYDWTACLISIAAGFATILPLIFAADWLFGSSGLLTLAAITAIGAFVARLVYARLAKPGARPLEPD